MRTSAPTENGEPREGVGTAMDGAIRCTAGLPGIVTSLELEPTVMRHASRDLAHQIAEAVNAALTDLRAKVAGAVTPVDPKLLSAQVAQLQDESIRQMERFTSAIGLAIEQIRRVSPAAKACAWDTTPHYVAPVL